MIPDTYTMLKRIKILANHYHSLLIKLTLSEIAVSVTPSFETCLVSYDIGTKSSFFKL